eukprot:489746-Hanusia_phi.AAC.5
MSWEFRPPDSLQLDSEELKADRLLSWYCMRKETSPRITCLAAFLMKEKFSSISARTLATAALSTH